MMFKTCFFIANAKAVQEGVNDSILKSAIIDALNKPTLDTLGGDN